MTAPQQISPPPAMSLASAGDASELDRLLQLERAKADSRALALEPADFAAAKEFAKLIAESGMFPDKDGRAPTMGSILLRIMTGRTLNIASSIALQHVYDVYGKTGLSAALKRALVRRHVEAERYEMTECDEKHCLWVCKRKRNIEHRFLWTVDRAAKAGLIKKDSNWERYPERMYQARSSSEAADVDFADAILGLPSIDEIYESTDSGLVVPSSYALPTTTGPARDWRKDTEEVKANVLRLVAEGHNREARELYATFKQDAPAEYANEIFDAYNKALAAKKGEAPPPPKAASKAGDAAPDLPVKP